MSKTKTIRPIEVSPNSTTWMIVIWEVSDDQTIAGSLDPRPPFQGATDFWTGEMWSSQSDLAKTFESKQAAIEYLHEKSDLLKSSPRF